MLNLYDRDWPIRTYQPPMPPPKFVHTDARPPRARRSTGSSARAASSPAARSAAASSRRDVRVNSYALVEDSILFDGVDVGRHCPHPPGDHRQGRQGPRRLRHRLRPRAPTARRGFTVTEEGITVVAKGEDLEQGESSCVGP